MKRKQLMVLVVGITAVVLLSAQLIAASTFVTNTTPGSGGAPAWLDPGWQFFANSDTSFGESVCIEVHPVGDTNANYIRSECVYDNTTLGGSNWRCDVFTAGVPAAFRNTTVEYQLFNDDGANDCSGGYNFTGFNWTFETGPVAIGLLANGAQPVSSSALILLAVGLLAVLLVGATAVVVARRSA